MAAATHYNDYLMKGIEDMMLQQGGDISYFYQEGLDKIPDKVKALGESNAILAH